jgi:hypothetical protein
MSIHLWGHMGCTAILKAHACGLGLTFNTRNSFEYLHKLSPVHCCSMRLRSCARGCDFQKMRRPTPATNTELQQQNTTTGGIATTRIRWPRHDLLRDVLRFLLEDNAKFYSARSWRHAFLRNHLLVYTLANHTQITHHTTTPLDCALPTVLLSKHSLVFVSQPRNPRITNLQFNASQMSDKALGSMSAF